MNQDFYTVAPGEEPSSPRAVDCFVPEKITRKRAIFCIHGKDWKEGGRSDLHLLCRAFRERGFICGSADYRQGEGITAFDQLSDVRLAYERFAKEVVKLGAEPRIVVFGMTAGAHLASLLLCADPGECGEEVLLTEPWLVPEAGILQSPPAQFSPWVEMFPHIWSKMQSIAGKPYVEAPELYERLSLKNYIRPDNPKIFFYEAGQNYLFPSPMIYPLVEKHWSYRIESWFKIYRHATGDFFSSLTHYDELLALDDMTRFAEC